MHEQAATEYFRGCYSQAEIYSRQALAKLKRTCEGGSGAPAAFWQALFNNLAHALRKQRKYAEALATHERALALAPDHAGTLSGMAFVQALMGRRLAAVEGFHKALALAPEDSFCAAMLTSLLEEDEEGEEDAGHQMLANLVDPAEILLTGQGGPPPPRETHIAMVTVSDADIGDADGSGGLDGSLTVAEKSSISVNHDIKDNMDMDMSAL